MGDGLVSETYADKGSVTNHSPLTYTEIFEEQCPFYLSIGMSWDQYWNDDPGLVRFYVKAHELRNDRKNQEMWLQGLYVYAAIMDVSPILHAFAKRGTKAEPYMSEPLPVTANAIKRQREEEKAKTHMESERDKFMAFASAFNSRFDEKKEEGSED